MYSRPSSSRTRAPRPSRKNTGVPPTEPNARTGEFTPPGMRARERSNSARAPGVVVARDADDRAWKGRARARRIDVVAAQVHALGSGRDRELHRVVHDERHAVPAARLGDGARLLERARGIDALRAILDE